MTKKTLLIAAILIAFGFLINGCSRTAQITKLTNVEKFEQYSKVRLDKVLVVGKPIKEQNRKDFEKYFSKKLKRRKTDAIPGYEMIPDMSKLNRNSIKDAADTINAGAVLIAKVVGVDDKSVVVSQRNEVETFYTAKGTFTTITPFLEAPHVKNYVNVRIETALFDAMTEKMLWTASSTIIAPDSVNEAIDDFSKAIIEQLRWDGFLQ